MTSALRIDDAAGLLPMTAEEFLALDVVPKLRLELLDGELILTPSPTHWHNDLAYELKHDLRPQMVTGLVVSSDLDVHLENTDRIMRPDVLLVRKDAVLGNAKPLSRDVLLAIEIVSPGSTFNDRRTKPEVYAAAGLDYWRIENEQRQLVLYRHWPDDRKPDRVTGKHIETVGPVTLTLDLDGLRDRIAKYLP
jgi:Uma2 family endonuclease